jgi:hypothetical protein
MECNVSLDPEEESQWYEQCGELIKKLDSYKASIELLSDNNDELSQQFNQSLKLLKTELEFEEQKTGCITTPSNHFSNLIILTTNNTIVYQNFRHKFYL